MEKLIKTVIWPVILAPAVYLALVWNRLPERVAIHFDLQGQPDSMGSKKELITTAIILILMNAVVYLVLTNIYRIDPKKYAAENKGRLKRIGLATALFLSAILCMIIYSSVSGSIKFSAAFIFGAVGLLFAIIGNYMPNLKPNYFAGLRLPWTLENADNWRKTHQLAGKLWFAGGLGLAILCIFIPPSIALIIFYTVTAIITIIPCIYSYNLYRKQKAGK